MRKIFVLDCWTYNLNKCSLSIKHLFWMLIRNNYRNISSTYYIIFAWKCTDFRIYPRFFLKIPLNVMYSIFRSFLLQTLLISRNVYEFLVFSTEKFADFHKCPGFFCNFYWEIHLFPYAYFQKFPRFLDKIDGAQKSRTRIFLRNHIPVFKKWFVFFYWKKSIHKLKSF